MNIRCIAIDDEPLAVKKIAGYIQKVPFLELVGECRSASEAMSI
ncbi:MAG: DNA-binding response regulator, partial [Lentimicrobium sp.]|nr:DNA-binding response regulator [Lentimicrobium sp.]